MAPRRQPMRGGGRANEAQDALRVKEATGAGGTGAIGAAAGGAVARVTAASHPVPGEIRLFLVSISFEIFLILLLFALLDDSKSLYSASLRSLGKLISLQKTLILDFSCFQ